MNPEAKSLIELERDADPPSSEDRARVRRALSVALGASAFTSAGAAAANLGGTVAAGKVAAGVGVTGAGASVPSAAGATIVGSAKLLVWTGVALVAGLTTTAATLVAVNAVEVDAPPPLPVASSAPPVASAPGTVSQAPLQGLASDEVEPGRAEQELPTETTPESPAKSPPVAPVPRASAPPVEPRAGLLEGELPLIEQAQSALRQGDARRTLAILAEHERRFPDGMLVEERLASRALALCKLDLTVEARKTADRLRRRAPQSPLWPRVLEACRFDE